MNQEEGKPTMLNAEQVAQRLNMSKGFACKIIQEMNEEQIKKGRAVVKGRLCRKSWCKPSCRGAAVGSPSGRQFGMARGWALRRNRGI